MARRLLRRFVASRNGSVILETAIMITILLMLMFGIVDLGRFAMPPPNGRLCAPQASIEAPAFPDLLAGT